MMKKITLILLIGLMALPLFAAGKQETGKGENQEAVANAAADKSALEGTVNDPRLFQPGKLTVATGDPVYPPWMMDNDPASGKGFESALVYAVAAELGFNKEDVVWVRKTFDEGIAPGPKDYDFNIQQYSITEDRKKFVDFSIPYYQPENAVVALPSSDFSNARTFADLRKAKWGATIGTTDLDYIENVIGVKNVAVFSDQMGTFQAIMGKQIDATVISLPTALYATAVEVPEAKISAILPSDPHVAGFGMVFEKGNPIVPWINKAIKAVIDKGIVADLTAKYLIGGDDIPVIKE